MELYGWEFATVLSKLFVYLGIAAAVGGIFISLMVAQHRKLVVSIRKYSLWLISGAIVAACASFFIQVGAFAESGFAGMVDEMFIDLLWQSNVGNSMLLIVLALVLMLFASLLVAMPDVRARYISVVVTLTSLVIMTNAFTLVGHTSQLSFVTKILLGIHLSIAAWWMGALWPLWRACCDVANEPLHDLMEKFGRYAAISVLLLIICGSLLGLELVGSFEALLFTAYGQGIAIKLLMVSLILLIAAYHKWQLVPALLSKQSSEALASSIKIEMHLGLIILGITTVASTLTGPVH